MLRVLSMVDALSWHLHLVGGGSGTERSDLLRLADNLGKPIKEDRNRFETDLSGARLRQIRAAKKQSAIDLSGIAKRSPAFSWGGIFKKVQAVYEATMAAR